MKRSRAKQIVLETDVMRLHPRTNTTPARQGSHRSRGADRIEYRPAASDRRGMWAKLDAHQNESKSDRCVVLC
jgi:hypothetical protein